MKNATGFSDSVAFFCVLVMQRKAAALLIRPASALRGASASRPAGGHAAPDIRWPARNAGSRESRDAPIAATGAALRVRNATGRRAARAWPAHARPTA